MKNLENQAEEYKDLIRELQIEEQSLENEIELFEENLKSISKLEKVHKPL